MDLKKWFVEELSSKLGFAIDNEVIEYLISMKSKDDVEKYLYELLGKNTSPEFMREFLLRWTLLTDDLRSQGSEQGGEIMIAHKKTAEDQLELFSSGAKNKSKKAKKDKTSSSKTSSDLKIVAPPPGFSKPPSDNSSMSPHLSGVKKSGAASKTTKFVPLLSNEGQSKMSIRFPGRHPCQCLGQKHDLINNCLECGRIVCTQEGSGPCLFCGNVVFTKHEEKLLKTGSHRDEKKKEKILKQYNIQNDVKGNGNYQVKEQGLSDATHHRDKLLEFDKTSVRRTKVIDDQSDYFSVDSQWINEKERALLKEREKQYLEAKHSRNTKITLNFAGRRVIEEDDPVDLVEEYTAPVGYIGIPNLPAESNRICNPVMNISPPIYKSKTKKKPGVMLESEEVRVSRVQDESLMQMIDKGMCLSLHQPWASMLVCGIKRHEGRTWYAGHRGKLWIASTAQPVKQEDIKIMEQFYTNYYSDKEVVFPTDYPHGCLLGSVELTDCLSMEEYAEKYPNGETESPYVFICQYPQELCVKFPVKGKHKIWRLPKELHITAKRSQTMT